MAAGKRNWNYNSNLLTKFENALMCESEVQNQNCKHRWPRIFAFQRTIKKCRDHEENLECL